MSEAVTTSVALHAPAAIGAKAAAALCSISERTWWDMDVAHQNPAPVQLLGRKVWVVRELEAWLLAGAPPRERWQALRGKALAK